MNDNVWLAELLKEVYYFNPQVFIKKKKRLFTGESSLSPFLSPYYTLYYIYSFTRYLIHVCISVQ